MYICIYVCTHVCIYVGSQKISSNKVTIRSNTRYSLNSLLRHHLRNELAIKRKRREPKRNHFS